VLGLHLSLSCQPFYRLTFNEPDPERAATRRESSGVNELANALRGETGEPARFAG
jgi:hypothetical protein